MFNFIAENWYVFVAIIAIIAVGGFAAYTFIKLPTSAQVDALKEWLRYAVTMAEKELGGGTGQLKLRMVYNLFLDKFTWLAKFITFETFSEYVDEALVWMKQQLSTNKSMSALVTGAEAETTTEQ